MNLLKIVKNLANEAGVSGEEEKAAALAVSYLKKYTDDVSIRHGNVIANFGKREPGKPHLALDAHIDQIGFIVTYITDDGFIKVGNCGGIDRRLLAAQQVVIHGKRELCGIVCSTPPHLSEGEKKIPEISEFYIDTGYSKEEVSEYVQLGDKIRFSVQCEELLGGRITGGALDDRAGVAAILYAVDLLKGEDLSCSYTVLFTVQEELGERGAHIGAYDAEADIAIAVDVGFGVSEPDDEEGKFGRLGKGGMIGISPSLDRGLSEGLIHLAKKAKLPYQVEIMPGMTSTNADQYSVAKSGARAVTLSIPLKYMHTPVEVAALSDIKNVGKLLAECIRKAETL